MTPTGTIKQARTCYDHLAGQLGVAVTEAMITAGYLERAPGFGLTEAGLAWFPDALGIAPDSLFATRRPAARSCLDWTERRPHLAGAAGAALCGQFFDQGWVERSGQTRAVRVTEPGAISLHRLLAVEWPTGP
jgi:hypothetical protein